MIDEELAIFDAAMARLAEEILKVQPGTPEWHVLAAEVEVRIARLARAIANDIASEDNE